MTTLKPCPFCGGIGTLWSIDQCDTAYAVCQDCGARTVDYKHAEKAIAAWNRRSDAMPVVRGEWRFRSNGHNITRIGDYEEWHDISVCK